MLYDREESEEFEAAIFAEDIDGQMKFWTKSAEVSDNSSSHWIGVFGVCGITLFVYV